MSFNPLVPAKIKITDIKMNLLQFDRVDGPEHDNRIEFRFSLNPFDPGGFKIRKMRYCKKIPVVEISQSYARWNGN